MKRKPRASRRSKARGKTRSTKKAAPRRRTARPKARRVAKRSPAKAARRRASARPKLRKRSASSRTASRPRKKAARTRSSGRAGFIEPDAIARGLGPAAAGQSGDIEGLPHEAVADSESVEELAEEGQAFEAGIVDAVENAPDADQGELRTREVPEDDVPEEYLDDDRPSRR